MLSASEPKGHGRSDSSPDRLADASSSSTAPCTVGTSWAVVAPTADVVLISSQAHLLQRLHRPEPLVAPGPRELPRDPGMGWLPDRQGAALVLAEQHPRRRAPATLQGGGGPYVPSPRVRLRCPARARPPWPPRRARQAGRERRPWRAAAGGDRRRS